MQTETKQLSLQVLLPTHRLLEQNITKIRAKAVNGEFCILPKHIDFVSTLIPSILSYVSTDSEGELKQSYLAIDHGVLVKCSNTVTVSVLDGICSDDLQLLQEQVHQHFNALDEQEKKARAALARIEAATLRRFLELQERSNEFI